MLSRIKDIGPGALVAAAFIGPGTVTACTLAGANFGYALLWALVFAIIATIILFAQFANGLLLPIIASFLLHAMNRKDLLGKYANSFLANLLGGVVVIITAGLGLKMILKALNIF